MRAQFTAPIRPFTPHCRVDDAALPYGDQDWHVQRPGPAELYGQVVFTPEYGTGPVRLWTPDQPRSGTGSMTSMSGFLPYNGSFNSSSLLIDDFGRIAVKPNGYPFIRWTPSAPNASQGMYSAFNGTPANPVSWLRSMNSYGQLFGAFQIGNTQQYGIWTPASPTAAQALVRV